MNIARINLNLLIAFKVLYEECSVTRAGQRLGVTQAAMSNTLNQLRELFQDPLFTRLSKGIIPTKKSEALILLVSSALSEVEKVFVENDFVPKTSKQVFTLALSDHGEFIILPKLVKLFDQHAPNIKLKIKRLQRNTGIELFNDSELSCAIGFYSPQNKQLKRVTLITEDGVCVMRQSNKLAKEKLTLKAYLSSRHIAVSYSEQQQQPTYIDKALASQHLQRNVTLKVPHIITALTTIQSTDLIGTFPSKLSHHLAKQFKLALKTPPFKIQSCPVEMIWHTRVDNDPANIWLRQTIQSLLP